MKVGQRDEGTAGCCCIHFVAYVYNVQPLINFVIVTQARVFEQNCASCVHNLFEKQNKSTLFVNNCVTKLQFCSFYAVYKFN